MVLICPHVCRNGRNAQNAEATRDDDDEDAAGDGGDETPGRAHQTQE